MGSAKSTRRREWISWRGDTYDHISPESVVWFWVHMHIHFKYVFVCVCLEGKIKLC